jgi:autotransporter translocation and assembly factor TamB
MKNKSAKNKKVWRRLVRAVAYLSVLLVVLTVFLLLFVQTVPGRKILAKVLSEKISGNGLYVKISGIEKGLPAVVAVDALTVSDKQGQWLQVDDVRLEWAWREIFGGKFKVNLVQIGSIEVMRKPVKGKGKKKRQYSPPDLSFLKKDRFEIGKLLLSKVHLAKDLSKRDITFSVSADRALQQVAGKLKSELLFAGDLSGNVIAELNLSGQTGEGGLALSVLVDSVQVLSAKSDLLKFDCSVLFHDSYYTGATGVLLERDGASVTGSFDYRKSIDSFAVSNVLIKSGASQVAGNIVVDADKRIDGKFDLSLSDLEQLGNIVDIEAGGYIECNALFAGSAGEQSLQVKMSGNGFVGSVVAVSNLVFDLDITDVYNISNGMANISCDYIGWKTLVLNKSEIGMKSGKDAQMLTGNIDGKWGIASFALSATGGLTFADNIIGLDISTVSASFAEIEVEQASVSFNIPVGRRKNDKAAGVDLKIAIKSDARIDALSHLPIFVNNIIKGDLGVDLVYHKQASGVTLRGKSSLKNGYFENYISGTIFDNLNIALEAHDRKLVITEGNATDGRSGNISLGGYLDLSSFIKRILDIDVNFKNCLLFRRDDLEMTASGDLKLKGVGNDLNFTGSINVNDGRVDMNNMAPSSPMVLVDSNIAKEEDDIEGDKPHSWGWNTDIAIKTVGSFYIVGQALSSVWGADLHFINGKNGAGLKGEVEARSGSFLFLSRKFIFDRGQVSFDGGWPPVPSVNIVMIYERADIRARLIISGKADNPRISMDSIPAMPEDEVFAHILFGKNLSQISSLQAVQIATSMQGMRDGSNIDFMQKTKQSFGFDKLGFDTMDNNDGTDGTSTTLAVGKYLGEGLYTEVNAPIGGKSDTRVSVEYELRRNLTVETEAGVNMRLGLGINWKKDY